MPRYGTARADPDPPEVLRQKSEEHEAREPPTAAATRAWPTHHRYRAFGRPDRSGRKHRALGQVEDVLRLPQRLRQANDGRRLGQRGDRQAAERAAPRHAVVRRRLPLPEEDHQVGVAEQLLERLQRAAAQWWRQSWNRK